jgi:hypothetical protein
MHLASYGSQWMHLASYGPLLLYMNSIGFLQLGDILNQVKICTWNSGSDLFGSYFFIICKSCSIYLNYHFIIFYWGNFKRINNITDILGKLFTSDKKHLEQTAVKENIFKLE